MENVMCHVGMVVRRSTLAYHNFVFGSAYAISGNTGETAKRERIQQERRRKAEKQKRTEWEEEGQAR